MTAIHGGWATSPAAFVRRTGAAAGPTQFLPLGFLAAGGDGHRSVPAVAGEAGAGFATPTDLLLLGAVAILAVGLLLVFIWTRRAARDEAADASAPPAWERPAGPPPEQLRPPVPLLPAQPRGTTPLERRRPMPPDAAFTVIERGQDGARHRAADPPAPAMLSNQALITGRVAGPEGHPVSGGKLTVSDFSGSPAGIGRSATDGRYRLHLPTGGTYLLVCTAEGHQSTTVMVTVAAATLVCDIVLGGAGGIDGWIRHQRGEAASASWTWCCRVTERSVERFARPLAPARYPMLRSPSSTAGAGWSPRS